MRFGSAFFELQLQFARLVSRRFGLTFADAIERYTTLSRILSEPSYRRFCEGLDGPGGADDAGAGSAGDPIVGGAWAEQCYRDDAPRPPSPDDREYLGRPQFGCFSYVLRVEGTIRIHFINNDAPSAHPLAHERMSARTDELKRMFAHIGAHVPEATTVAGNSWLYNLGAYRRLFPPDFVARRPVNEQAEFQYLAFWGQCFDAELRPRAELAARVLESTAAASAPAELRWCFPFQALTPRCAIGAFYRFYGISSRA